MVARAGAWSSARSRAAASDAFGVAGGGRDGVEAARLRRLAGLWLQCRRAVGTDVRFDVASVVRGQVAEVIEAAF